MKGVIKKGKKKITDVCRRYTHLGKQNVPLEFINSSVPFEVHLQNIFNDNFHR